MDARIEQTDVDRLEGLVGDDPGSPAFPALADALRRTGRAQEGVDVARAGLARRPDAVAGRVALGLALLDLGRADEARAALEQVLETAPDHPLARDAIERHPGAARWERPPPPAPEQSERLEHIGAPEVDAAFDEAASEPAAPLDVDDVAERTLDASDFGNTETDERDAAPTMDEGAVWRRRPGDANVVATLERWLDNLRGGQA